MSYSRRELYALGEPLGESVTVKKAGGGYICGGGGGGGSPPPPSPQQVTSTTTNIPDWLKDPTQQMVAQGQALSNQPYQQYQGQLVASMSPLQIQAYNTLANMGTPAQMAQAQNAYSASGGYGAAGANAAMAYQPTQFTGYQMAQPGNVSAQNVYGTGYGASNAAYAPQVRGTGYGASTVGALPALTTYQMGGPDTWTSETAKQYADPYQQAVTDIAKREATTEAQRLNAQAASQAAKAGAFGGSRFGVEQALLGKSLSQNLADIQTKGSQAAYQSGLAQFNAEQQMKQAAGVQNLQAALGVQSLGSGQNLQAVLANQAAENQAAQFGAQQGMTAQQANQAAYQQTALANQAAQNQAAQFGAQQGMTAQQLNQQYNLAAQQANQQAALTTGQQNLAAMLSVQQQQDAARQAAANMNLQGAQFGAQTMSGLGTNLANLGTTQQANQLQLLNAQTTAGQQMQAQQQAELTSAYNQYLDQLNWQRNQLGYLSGLIRGTPFSTTSTATTQAAAPSTTSQLAGLGIAGLGLSKLLS